MSYVAPITGYVDPLGYLFCCDCIGDRAKDAAVYGDNAAFTGSRCERCRWVFPKITSKQFVRCEAGRPAHELR